MSIIEGARSRSSVGTMDDRSLSMESASLLREFKVSPQPRAAGPDPEIGKARLVFDLKNALGLDDKKSKVVSSGITGANLAEAFNARLVTDKDWEKFKGLLHFRGRDGCTMTKGERMLARTALAICFARGATVENLDKLRKYCVFNALHDRNDVLSNIFQQENVNEHIETLWDNPDFQRAYLLEEIV